MRCRCARGARCRGARRPAARRRGRASPRCRPRRSAAARRGAATQRAAIAATRLESRPPDRNTPTGTSPISWRSTERDQRLAGPARSSPRAPAPRAGSGIALAKRTSPPLGRPRAAGRERLDEAAASPGRRRASRDAKRTRRRRCAQYSGLMPTGSRAATKRPSSAAATEREHAVELVRAPRARARRAAAARPRCRSRSAPPGRRAGRGRPRGCRPRRCRRARTRPRGARAAAGRRSTSTIDRRRWPSQASPTSTDPVSSGPRWATRSSIRSSAAGSAPPC